MLLNTKTDLIDCTLKELEVQLAAYSLPAYRIRQLYHAIHKNFATDFNAITTFPASLRDSLEQSFSLKTAEIVKEVSAKDGAVKYLLRLTDDNYIESVYIPSAERGTLCISTMVGCPYGCTFCASGKAGFKRNLTTSEILTQFYLISRKNKITNIVYMGMGEPLANYNNVVKSVRMIADKDGRNMSPRHITISTVGIVDGIKNLANEKLPLNLAVSLHSPFQTEREKIIPSAKTFSINDIINACHYYINRTGRKVAFEYTVIPDVNDRTADADELYKLTKNSQIMINLIPLNDGKTNMREHVQRAKDFANLLREREREVVVRNSRGNDIYAACGQLQIFRPFRA